MPEELWMEVHNTVQEAVTKTIPKKKNARSKVVVSRCLMNSREKKRIKKQRRRERYIQLNAEFQRIARRDKKAFFSEQCKELQENNRMGQS